MAGLSGGSQMIPQILSFIGTISRFNLVKVSSGWPHFSDCEGNGHLKPKFQRRSSVWNGGIYKNSAAEVGTGSLQLGDNKRRVNVVDTAIQHHSALSLSCAPRVSHPHELTLYDPKHSQQELIGCRELVSGQEDPYSYFGDCQFIFQILCICLNLLLFCTPKIAGSPPFLLASEG